MSEECAPRYLQVSRLPMGNWEASICAKCLYTGVRLTPCVTGCQAGIALYIHTYIQEIKQADVPYPAGKEQELYIRVRMRQDDRPRSHGLLHS